MEKQMKMKTKEALIAYLILVLIVVSICAGIGAGVVYTCKYMADHDKAILYLTPCALIILALRAMAWISNRMVWNYTNHFSSRLYFLGYVLAVFTIMASTMYLITLIFA